jgi:D-sedoheptulose 7-phosphate isomerase
MDESRIVKQELSDYAQIAQSFASDASNADKVAVLAHECVDRLKRGGKILAVGNGGSCADAMHFCEELTGRYRADRPSIGAIACTDPGHLTCTGNDFGFDRVFSRWIEGVGRSSDVLVVLSTSGNSANIIHAVESAKALGIHTAALLGKGGGTLAGMCDIEWIVPGQTSDRVQELHMLILHALVGSIERVLHD